MSLSGSRAHLCRYGNGAGGQPGPRPAKLFPRKLPGPPPSTPHSLVSCGNFKKRTCKFFPRRVLACLPLAWTLVCTCEQPCLSARYVSCLVPEPIQEKTKCVWVPFRFQAEGVGVCY